MAPSSDKDLTAGDWRQLRYAFPLDALAFAAPPRSNGVRL